MNAAVPGEIVELGSSALLCGIVRWLLAHPSVSVGLTVAALLLVVYTSALLWRWVGSRKAGAATTSPWLVASWLLLALIYAGGRLTDLVASKEGLHHPLLGAADTARAGWVEWQLLTPTHLWSLVPLADRFPVALLLHALLWGPALLVLYGLLASLTGSFRLKASLNPADAPRWYAWTGCSTNRGIDSCVRVWLLPFSVLVAVAIGLCLATYPAPPAVAVQTTVSRCVAGVVPPTLAAVAAQLGEGAAERPPLPGLAPGALVLFLLLLPVLFVHCMKPRPMPAEEEEEEKPPEPAPPPLEPLALLREQVRMNLPGCAIGEELVALPGSPGASPGWPEGVGGLLRRFLDEVTLPKGATAYQTQADVVAAVRACVRLSSGPPAAALGLDLRDEALLLTGPDGVGRLTTLFAAALTVHHERGGTSLVLCRSARRARELGERYRTSVAGSAARWSVLVSVGSDGLRGVLTTGRLPAIVIADLHTVEQTLLVESANDRLLQALDAVLLDQLDEFVGAQEMHLSLVLRRLWLALEQVDRRPEPPVVIATGASSTGDTAAWASQLLGRRTVPLECSGPPLRDRIVVRRKDLLRDDGGELGIFDLARACEAAQLPWHLRMSGPGRRRVRRAEGALAGLSRFRANSPGEAAVVLLEGAHGEVEGELLVTALVARDSRFAHGIQVAVPPVEEELALSPLGAALPWVAVPLDPPESMRLVHLARALAHRELRRDGLVDLVLGARSSAPLDAWSEAGAVVERSRLVLAPTAYQPVEERLVARANAAPPLPDLDVQCTTSSPVRLLQVETGQTLERTDAALGGTRYYPGAVLLLEQGRFQVTPSPERWCVSGGYGASLLEHRLRSIPERSWAPAESLWRLSSTDRSHGKQTLRCRSGMLELHQRVTGVRIYGPERELVEVRDLSPAIETALPTRVVLLMSAIPAEPDPAQLRPVAAALAMVTPSVLRAAREVVHVGLLQEGGCAHLAFLDRTPGGNGVAAAIDGGLLFILLRAALAVLQALPEPMLARLGERFDEHPGAHRSAWDVPGAIAWLEAIVNPVEPGAPRLGPQLPLPDDALLERLRQCFPPLAWFPPEEAVLLCEWVQAALTSVPMRPRYGAFTTEEDRLLAAVGLAAVFYRRPDLDLPDGFHVTMEPGTECHDPPGCAGYCACFGDWHIGLALEVLRASARRDGYPLAAHEAAHLMDALDGVADGLLPGQSLREKSEWLSSAVALMPAVAQGDSVLPPYAATDLREFLAEAVAAFVAVPTELKRRLPLVYNGLCRALRQDPARWQSTRGGEGER